MMPIDTSMVSNILGAFSATVASLGAEAEPFMRQAGIDPAAQDTEKDCIPLKAAAKLLEIAAVALACKDLGLRMAAVQSKPENRTTPSDELANVAPTLRELFDCLPQHCDIASSGIRQSHIHLPHDDRWIVRFNVMLEALPLLPQLLEYLLLLVHNGACYLTGGRAQAREVWMSHSPHSPPEVYRALFGTTVRFSQECDALIYTDKTFEMRLVGSNEHLFKDRLHRMLTLFPSKEDTIEIKARDAILILLADGEVERYRVAEFLNMSPRTLNRKLSQYGKSFEVVRDEVRQALALRYLTHSDLQLCEIAGKLGYAETAVLSRACQRWFNRTPSQLRRQMKAGWWIEPPRDGQCASMSKERVADFA